MTNVQYEMEDYRDIETLNLYQERLEKGYSREEIMRSIHAKSRDNARTPMQWNDGENAGFTKGTPWLKSLGEWVVQRGRLVGYYGPGGNIEIPEQVKIIESYIFEGRSDLTSITLPPSIKAIAMNAFEGCEKLTIHAPAGSFAEEYAKKNKIKFEALP